jgi:hypothetical protein
MKTTRVTVALCILALAVSCGEREQELSREKAQKILESSPAFTRVYGPPRVVTRKILEVTGVRNEGKRAFADIDYKWESDTPFEPQFQELLTTRRTATARFLLYDDGWRYDGLVGGDSLK